MTCNYPLLPTINSRTFGTAPGQVLASFSAQQHGQTYFCDCQAACLRDWRCAWIELTNPFGCNAVSVSSPASAATLWFNGADSPVPGSIIANGLTPTANLTPQRSSKDCNAACSAAVDCDASVYSAETCLFYTGKAYDGVHVMYYVQNPLQQQPPPPSSTSAFIMTMSIPDPMPQSYPPLPLPDTMMIVQQVSVSSPPTTSQLQASSMTLDAMTTISPPTRSISSKLVNPVPNVKSSGGAFHSQQMPPIPSASTTPPPSSPAADAAIASQTDDNSSITTIIAVSAIIAFLLTSILLIAAVVRIRQSRSGARRRSEKFSVDPNDNHHHRRRSRRGPRRQSAKFLLDPSDSHENHPDDGGDKVVDPSPQRLGGSLLVTRTNSGRWFGFPRDVLLSRKLSIASESLPPSVNEDASTTRGTTPVPVPRASTPVTVTSIAYPPAAVVTPRIGAVNTPKQ